MKRLVTLASVATCALTSLGVTVPATTAAEAAGNDSAMPNLAYPKTKVSYNTAEARCTGAWSYAYPGAMVCYQASGDHLYVCDVGVDGHRAWAEVHYRGDFTRYTTDYGARYCTDHNWDLGAEGSNIGWQAEVWNGSDYLYQGDWEYGGV
jgi:hypothetical protein